MEDLLAVEMEAASLAQVAKQEKIPFQIIRVISAIMGNIESLPI